MRFYYSITTSLRYLNTKNEGFCATQYLRAHRHQNISKHFAFYFSLVSFDLLLRNNNACPTEYIGLYMVETTITTKEASLLFSSIFFYWSFVIRKSSSFVMKWYYILVWTSRIQRKVLWSMQFSEIYMTLWLCRCDLWPHWTFKTHWLNPLARSIFNIRSIADEIQSEL